MSHAEKLMSSDCLGDISDAPLVTTLPAPSRQPSLGASAGELVNINLEKLLATRLLIQAASGGGKSWALRRILEQTYGLVQQVVIDPEGELESLADKYDYLVCSPDSETARITEDTGAAVAKVVIRSGRSVIISLGEFDIEAMQQFVNDFLRELMKTPKELWRHLIVSVDEAQLFAPQHDEAHCKKAMIDLAGRGRKRGFCLIAATLRLSQLHKGVASHLNNKLIGLTTLDTDIKRAADQLGMALNATKPLLKGLDAGEFIAYGPGLSYDLKRVKIGSVVSAHGTLGKFQAIAPPPTMSREELMAAINNAAEQADQFKGKSHTSEGDAEESIGDVEGLGHEGNSFSIPYPRYEAIRPFLQYSGPNKGDRIRKRAQELGVGYSTLCLWIRQYVPTVGPRSLEGGNNLDRLRNALRATVRQSPPEMQSSPFRPVLKMSRWFRATRVNPYYSGWYECMIKDHISTLYYWNGKRWFSNAACTIYSTFGNVETDRWRGASTEIQLANGEGLAFFRDPEEGTYVVVRHATSESLNGSLPDPRFR